MKQSINTDESGKLYDEPMHIECYKNLAAEVVASAVNDIVYYEVAKAKYEAGKRKNPPSEESHWDALDSWRFLKDESRLYIYTDCSYDDISTMIRQKIQMKLGGVSHVL